MKKIKTLLKGPFLSNSGYGLHSREAFRALFLDPTFDVFVECVDWGNTPSLTEDTDEKSAIKSCIQKFALAKQKDQDRDFDLFVHVTIPNEFEKRAKINIGVTAGIETDKISHVWVQKCQEMDLIIVPSEHSKNVIEKTVVDWKNPNTGEQGSFKLNKPVVVCSEGVDTEIFKPYRLTTAPDEVKSIQDKFNFEPDFCFLHVGQWGKGGFGEDRKNISNLVKYFIETFKGRNDVGLVLKTNMSRNSEIDRQTVAARLKQIKANFKEEDVPPIYLLHGNMTPEEMSALYNHPKIKSFVSLTHGEGYGRPLLESAACGLPVVATNWSGHLDFLKGKFSAVNYKLEEVPEVAVWEPIVIKGSRWAAVDEEDAKRRLKKIVSSYSKPQEWASELTEEVKEEFDIQVVCQVLNDTIKQFLKVSEKGQELDPVEYMRSVIDSEEDYNILYTMPQSNGDVFVSTAVIDGLMKQVLKHQDKAKLYFATKKEYFPILEDNPNVHKVFEWKQFMMNMDVSEQVFDMVLTPDTATQYLFSNWIRRGEGRLLAEEYANHCQVELGDYWIREDEVDIELPENYITFHPGPGEGQWEARKYVDWPEVLTNLKRLYPNLKIVQVGGVDEPKFAQCDVDLRGKTTVHQLAYAIKHSSMHLSIDTFTMHMAGAYDIPLVSLFGCSYATSTGPWVKDRENSKMILLESERRTCGCVKACYKNKPVKPIDYAPINEIDPQTVFRACEAILKGYE